MGNIHPDWYNWVCSGFSLIFSLISLLMPGRAGMHISNATAEEARVWSAARACRGTHVVTWDVLVKNSRAEIGCNSEPS